MLKLVWCDYKGQAWSALKNVYNSGGWFFYIYMGIILPLIYSDSTYEVEVYYSALGPMSFGMLLSRMYPNRINKTLMLCPMSVEDRKKYLVTGYTLRITIVLSFFLLCNIPLLITQKIMFSYFVVMFIFQILFVVSINVYSGSAPDVQGAFVRENERGGNFTAWDVAIVLCGILGILVLSSIQMSQKDFMEETLALVIVVILVLLELGICIKMLYIYYRPVMEQAIYYDTSYGKEKQNEINR